MCPFDWRMKKGWRESGDGWGYRMRTKSQMRPPSFRRVTSLCRCAKIRPDAWKLTVDKDSGIRNDPNDWSREHNQPRYILASSNGSCRRTHIMSQSCADRKVARAFRRAGIAQNERPCFVTCPRGGTRGPPCRRLPTCNGPITYPPASNLTP